MAGVPINGLTVFFNTTAAGVSAANALSTNTNGSVNGIGTAIGTLQAGQAIVSIGTTAVSTNTVPVAGALLGLAGAVFYANNMIASLSANGTVNASDLAGFVSDAASIVANGAVVAMAVIPATDGAGAILVPLAVVSGALSSWRPPKAGRSTVLEVSYKFH
jgi:hypothetical protein